jgi:hypothetical protein
MRVTVTDDNGHVLGVAARVIDLAEPEPGPPLYLTPMAVSGTRFVVGHTANLADPAEPVIVRQCDISDPPASGLAFAEGRCGGCTARVTLGNLGDDVMMILEHQPRCRAFRKLLAQARAR